MSVSSRSIDQFCSFCRGTYALYHRPSFIDPDPVSFVRSYHSTKDREIVGFLAASLALGRVAGILGAIANVLHRLESIGGRSPAETLGRCSPSEVAQAVEGFSYRFFDDAQMAAILRSLQRVLFEYGSIEAAFGAGLARPLRGGRADRGSLVLSGLTFLVDALRKAADGSLDRSILLAQPGKGSACKRLLLFLRWMVRADEIDPGGWLVIEPADLLVPLDTHMISIGRAFGILTSSTGSWKASLKLTKALALADPLDPVRFDFSLARLGIHPDLDKSEEITRGGFAESGDFATL